LTLLLDGFGSLVRAFHAGDGSRGTSRGIKGSKAGITDRILR